MRLERVKILIVYDSVSPSITTTAVAKTIGDILEEKGIEVDSFFVNDVDKAVVKNYDCLLVGAPTIQFKASPAIMQFLEGLPSNEFSGKLAAAFDTQIKLFMSGSAVKGIEEKLKGLDFRLFTKPLVVYVEGKIKENKWHFKEGELEKAKKWALELADTLSK